MLTFVEHPSFTKQIATLMEDDEYARFQKDLASGFARSAMERKARGSAEVPGCIYLILPLDGIIYLFYAYTKGDIEDMSPEQKKRLAKAVEEIKEHYEKRRLKNEKRKRDRIRRR